MSNIRKNHDKTDQELLDRYFFLENLPLFCLEEYNKYKAESKAIVKELGKDRILIEEVIRRVEELEKRNICHKSILGYYDYDYTEIFVMMAISLVGLSVILLVISQFI